MDPLITIPREALADLLRAAGSTLTPEEYAASLPTLAQFKKFPGRARMCAVNKSVMAVIAVIGVVSIPFIFDLENVIVVIGICVATYFEYRTHRYFRENNPQAPILGFRNQTLFSAGIVLYCLYHAIVPYQVTIPADYREVMDPSMVAMMQSMERVSYFFIGVIAGGSQFALAWYYRTAMPKS